MRKRVCYLYSMCIKHINDGGGCMLVYGNRITSGSVCGRPFGSGGFLPMIHGCFIIKQKYHILAKKYYEQTGH